MRHLLKKCIIVLTFVVAIFALIRSPIFAEDDVKKQYEDVQNEIERLQKQLLSIQNQERTLSNQIQQANSQIELTTLQITDVKNQIDQLAAEITVLQAQIDGLEISLEKVSNTMAERAVQSYQRGKLTPLKLLVASDGFENFVTKYAYLSYMQEYDKKVLLQLQDNQNTVSDKKTELVDKRTQIEKKKKQLESLKATLDGQKKAKESLLEITKNDEARYKKLLEAAKSKEEQLARLVFQGDKVNYSLSIYGLSKQGQVSAGQRIGTMGNSGYPRCTTAAHLHMEVIVNGKVDDNEISGDLISPFAYLRSEGVAYFKADNSIDVKSFGAGNWQWPLSKPTITQEFGKTPWSSRYLSGFHTGVDMVDYNDKSVRAPSGGSLYYAKINCGSAINIAIIDHGGGVFSDYLHLE